jgi:hypothetical protein
MRWKSFRVISSETTTHEKEYHESVSDAGEAYALAIPVSECGSPGELRLVFFYMMIQTDLHSLFWRLNVWGSSERDNLYDRSQVSKGVAPIVLTSSTPQ